MKAKTKEAVLAIARTILKVPIPLAWRINNPRSGGERLTRILGDGIEYIKTDEYEIGDRATAIDWFANAASDDPDALFTRRFEETRPAPVNLLVQVGKMMLFGTLNEDKSTLSARLAGSAINSAGTMDDLVRVSCFSRYRAEDQLQTATASSMFMRALVTILEANEREEKRPADRLHSGLYQTMRTLPPQKSLTFIFADFLHLSAEDKKAIKQTAAFHDVVCVVLTDPREFTLPSNGGLPIDLDDIETGATKKIYPTASNRRKFEAAARQRLEDLKTFCHEDARCSYAEFSTGLSGEEQVKAMMALFAGHRSRG